MGGRSRFILVLIVYSAGFATAVYWLGPPPTAGQGCQTTQAQPNPNAQRIAAAMNSGMHKAVALGKKAAEDIAAAIQTKIRESRKSTSSSG